MAWVKFLSDFDFRPAARRRVLIAYRKGQVENVTRECRDRAVEAGKAEDTAERKAGDGGNDRQDPGDGPAEEADQRPAGEDAGGGEEDDRSEREGFSFTRTG